MSSGTAIRPPVDRRVAASDIASPTEDLFTVIFAACLMAGTMSDGWAHTNILSDVQEEGFFTLWHALLYAGFGATAAWTFYLAYRRRHRAPQWWRDGFPAGYRLGALGALIFLAGGLGDMIWHTVLGIEVSLDALMSPTHLLLMIGTVLLVTSPLRSWWAAGGGGLRAAAGVVGLALAAMFASIFISHSLALTSVAPTLPYHREQQGTAEHDAAALGITSYLITIAFLVVPLLMVHRRRPTFGTAAALVGIVGAFPMVTNVFPRPQITAVLAATAAALLVDWILLSLDRTRGIEAPLRLPIAGAVFGFVVTAAHLLALHLDEGIRWQAELWTGTIVLATVIGAVLGGLAARPSDRPLVASER